MSLFLEIDWSPIVSLSNVNEACDYFYNILYSLFDVYVPKTLVRKLRYTMWFSKDIIEMIRLKNNNFKSYKCHNFNPSVREGKQKVIHYEVPYEWATYGTLWTSLCDFTSEFL